jgi:hypothetical protein
MQAFASSIPYSMATHQVHSAPPCGQSCGGCGGDGECESHDSRRRCDPPAQHIHIHGASGMWGCLPYCSPSGGGCGGSQHSHVSCYQPIGCSPQPIPSSAPASCLPAPWNNTVPVPGLPLVIHNNIHADEQFLRLHCPSRVGAPHVMILGFTRASATVQIQIINVPKGYTLKLDASPAAITSATLAIAGHTIVASSVNGSLTCVLPFHVLSGTGMCTLHFSEKMRKIRVCALTYP